jgi:hypothetical protein
MGASKMNNLMQKEAKICKKIGQLILLERSKRKRNGSHFASFRWKRKHFLNETGAPFNDRTKAFWVHRYNLCQHAKV